MRLFHLTADYLAYRRALGNRFTSEGFVLRSFCRHLGDVQLGEITPDGIRRFILNGGTTIATAARKRRILAGLYRYAHTRGYGKFPQLVNTRPKVTPVLAQNSEEPRKAGDFCATALRSRA